MITAEELRELLRYDPNTGIFRWKVKQRRVSYGVGDVAGSLDSSSGYHRIRIDGRDYRASRLAWLYVYGRWPTDEINHKNTIRDDDRLANLREATRGQNNYNTKRFSTNTSGLKGVCWRSRDRMWQAQISVNGRTRHLGKFDTPEEAHAVYRAAALERRGKFARFE